ncbi:hypothetical protein ruthe_02899 [Rubellimicrobium thermophilum DSM 16684]|uniref:CsgH-like domain-containing protein n=1 Tax=Rubellimicrobium thermophilum DSM 16684 TaxID=1123069 RepID=S9SAI8_9RHOB|nr:curli-like amyloid fiber formation chaperone CsgH [Rubellimicrobium thermophilum]EPX83274.1 hypothetical protein ruthe_02899 [Rubellimicrobium thermophilum DSM 16684]
MTLSPTTIRSPMTLVLAALVLTACAMAFGASPAGLSGVASGGALASGPLYGPVQCVLELGRSGNGLVLAGQVTARRNLSGEYSLHVQGRGIVIDQGGPFSLSAGERATLGRANLPGRAEDYTLRLIVEAAGRRVACPVETD